MATTFVYLFEKNNSKSYEQILMKFLGHVGNGTRNTL